MAAAQRPGRILRLLLCVPQILYRWRLGWLLGRRFVLLEHVGRASGRYYQTTLEVIDYDRSTGEVVVMSGWGRTSDWFLNVVKAGGGEITVGRQTTAVAARVLDHADAASLLADYERGNRWARPVIRRVLGHLAGFHYDGSVDSRMTLVRRLPLVRFAPVQV